MTTIAYNHKDKQIAVDGRSTRDSGTIMTDSAIKVEEINGVIFVMCGTVCDYTILTNMYFGDKSDVVPECNAFAVDGGIVYRCGCGDNGIFWKQRVTNDDALGSGTSWALAAMDFGKSAKEAVEYAITRDCFSGGKITVINAVTGEIING